MDTLSPLSIPHATPLNNGEGWLLSWDNDLATRFEVSCRSHNPQQVEDLEKILSQGHQKALAQLAS
jgi:hypothetical protein